MLNGNAVTNRYRGVASFSDDAGRKRIVSYLRRHSAEIHMTTSSYTQNIIADFAVAKDRDIFQRKFAKVG